MSRRYLVTGGTGFIGSALVKRLVMAGHRVRLLDDMSRGALRRIAAVAKDVELVEGDVRDAAAVSGATQDVDCIIHLAYVNGTEFFYTKPALVLDVAIRGMLAVLDACRQRGIGDLILASSAEVYQAAPVVPTDETAPLTVPDVMNPRYSYGGGKMACELMAINYGRTGFERVCIFRPHNVYGPDMGWEHVIPQFVVRAADLISRAPTGTIRFPVQGDGRQTRAFMHIEDCVEGVMHVIASGADRRAFWSRGRGDRGSRSLWQHPASLSGCRQADRTWVRAADSTRERAAGSRGLVCGQSASPAGAGGPMPDLRMGFVSSQEKAS